MQRRRFLLSASAVATFAEQGFKDIVFDEWFGVYMPANPPADVLERASAAVRAVLAAPDVVEGLARMGLDARPPSPAELAALLKKDGERWAPLIKQIGFTAES